MFVIAIAALRASVRANPRRHGGRVGLGLVGNDDAFPLRNLISVQHLCRTYRFGVELPRRFTVGFLWCMFVEKFAADRYRCQFLTRQTPLEARAILSILRCHALRPEGGIALTSKLGGEMLAQSATAAPVAI